jgi:hypothetical protein
LLLIPFYFFGALATFLALALITRILRLKIGANPLATAAVVGSIGILAVIFALDWVDLAHLTGRHLLVLGAATFVLAALDTLLAALLPSPVDSELAHF